MVYSTENLGPSLHGKIRKEMNDMADHIAGGGCIDFADYRKCCGVIEGLARAERELLDLTRQNDDD